MVRKITFLLLSIGMLLSACTASEHPTATQGFGTSTPTGALTPYHSPTATPARLTATIKITIPVTPSPTATPFLHTITNDDTLLGLAFRYGVSVEALKTANPTVNPNAMTVGSQLVIPIVYETPQENPTPTPMPVNVVQPLCYKTGDGGAWCIATLHNMTQTSLENLSVWLGLFDAQGQNFTSQVAYAPLDILLPGDSLPLMAYFAAPLPADFSARAELITASAIPINDNRYLPVEIKLTSVVIDPTAGQATIQGDLVLTQGAETPSLVWVLAVAYDAQGNIIGMRKWKSAGDTHFETTVYSLGGAIDHVDVLAEVRP
jgi:LysM repeat protein